MVICLIKSCKITEKLPPKRGNGNYPWWCGNEEREIPIYAPRYGFTVPQMVYQPEDPPELKPTEANTVQQVVDTFLYYAHTVESTMIIALINIAEEHARSTKTTEQKVAQLLRYLVTHSDAMTRYHTSGITLHMRSDTPLISVPGTKSR